MYWNTCTHFKIACQNYDKRTKAVSAHNVVGLRTPFYRLRFFMFFMCHSFFVPLRLLIIEWARYSEYVLKHTTSILYP